MSVPKSVKRVASVVIVTVIFFFLIRNIYTNWLEVSTYEWHFNYVLLVLSFLMLIITLILMVMIWHWKLLPLLGARITFRKAFHIWFISSLGRYIPGKVWQVVGMAYLTKKEGIAVETAITSAILAQVLAIIPGAILGVVTMVVVFSYGIQWIGLAVLIVLIGIILVYPPFLTRIINLIGRRFNRPPICITAPYRNILLIMFLYLIGWISYGIAFFLFTRSAVTVPAIHIVTFPGVFATAYLAGLIAVFVPGGLGVREGILATLMSNFFSLPIAAAIALASRLWFTLAEIVCVLIALRLSSKR